MSRLPVTFDARAASRSWWEPRTPGPRGAARGLVAGLLTPARTRAISHGLILGGLIISGWILLVLAPATGTFGFDAYAYWAVDAADPYRVPHGSLGSFAYSPPAVLAFDPLGSLHWWIFAYLWTALLVGTIVWLSGSLFWVVAAFAFPPVAYELYHGNIHLLLAAAVVLGFRHPWTWSFVLLTKMTSGVGLLWFVVRREWRALGIALGTTAVLAAGSWLVVPGLWAEWFAYVGSAPRVGVGHSAIAIPLSVRLVAAVAIVAWGARTDRRWTVIVAATLALPVLWIAGLAMLLGLAPEVRARRGARRGDGRPAVSGGASTGAPSGEASAAARASTSG